MTTMKQLKEAANRHGAKIEITKYPCGETTVEVIAPDSMQWVNGQCIHMLGTYWAYVNGDRQEVYNDLFNRISEGLEPLDTNINP